MNAVDPMKICYKTTDKLERVHCNEAPILGRLNRDGMVIVQLFRLLESMGYIAQKEGWGVKVSACATAVVFLESQKSGRRWGK